MDFGDSDDERGKTAHNFFASLAGIDEENKENITSSRAGRRYHPEAAPCW